MDNPQPTLSEIGWLAGIWDGEGTISASKRKDAKNVKLQFTIRVAMVNTDAKIIRKTADILDRSGISFYLCEKRHYGFGKKQCWILSVNRLHHAAKLMNLIGSHLVGKKAQGELLARFIDSRLSKFHGDDMGNLGRAGTTNGDRQYTAEELESLRQMIELNGDQRKGSEAILTAIDAAVPTEIKCDRCKAILHSILSGGPMRYWEVLKAVQKEGISERVLRKARQEIDLGITVSKVGKAWWWELSDPPDTSMDEMVHRTAKAAS